MSFQTNLKTARKAKGLTQLQVAELLGVTKSTYCGYETGKRQPDVKKIKRLAEILSVPADTLLETEKAPAISDEGMSPERKELLAIIDDLDDEAVKGLLDVVRAVKSLRGSKQE